MLAVVAIYLHLVEGEQQIDCCIPNCDNTSQGQQNGKKEREKSQEELLSDMNDRTEKPPFSPHILSQCVPLTCELEYLSMLIWCLSTINYHRIL